MTLPEIETLSHATIITGNRHASLESFKGFLAEQGIAVRGNPDVFIFEDEQLLIDDAFRIVAMLIARKVSNKRFSIISVDRMAHDVQNVLLKTIEEPQPGTHIVLMVPDTERLLPTILSRCQVIVGDGSIGQSRLDIFEFLAKGTADRFAFIESWTKNKKDEDNVSKTEVLNFIDALEKHLWEQGNRDEQLFDDIRKMREYANLRGGSHRIILDFLAMIVLP